MVAYQVTERATSDVPTIRQASLGFIAQIVGVINPVNLSDALRNELIQADVEGANDDEAGVREQAPKMTAQCQADCRD